MLGKDNSLPGVLDVLGPIARLIVP